MRARVMVMVLMLTMMVMLLLVGTMQAAYEQSLEVFELVEDVDKVSKVLINLSNMCEMQVSAQRLVDACVTCGKLPVQVNGQHTTKELLLS